MPLLSTGWVPVGPACGLRGQVGYDSYSEAIVGGRVTAIAFDSTHPELGYSEKIYVGTSSGGVWSSEDHGQTWRPMTDDRISLSIGALAVDPSTHKLYVAPGECKDSNIYAGNGLLIYDPNVADPAARWSFQKSAELDWVWSAGLIKEDRLVVPFGRPLYLGGVKTGGLRRSQDEGVTWESITVDAFKPDARVSGIAYVRMDAPENAVMYVALYGRGIWKRKGHEDTFENMSLPIVYGCRRIVVAACAKDPKHVLVVSASAKSRQAGIYTSEDGGENWIEGPKLDPEMKQTNYNLDVRIHPDHPNIMFIAEARLWRSEDHGKTWQIVSNPAGDYPGIHADQHVITYDPKNPDDCWAGNDGGIWFSSDGKTWSPRNRGLQNFLFYSFAHNPTVETVAIAGAQDNGTLRFEGSAAWRLVNGGDGFYVAIDPNTKKTWYASYCFTNKGKIAAFKVSDQYGDRFTFSDRVDNIANPFPTDDEPFYVPFVLDPKVPTTAYLGTTNLYVTGDSGTTGWQPISVKKGDGTDEVFDTSAARLNPTFSQAGRTGPHPEVAISSICVHPEDSSIVYVGTVDGRLFRLTKDPGKPWDLNQAGFTPAPGRCIADIAVPPRKPGDATSKVVYAAIGTPPASSFIQPWWVPGGRLFYSNDYGNTFVPRNDANLNITIDGVLLEHNRNAVNAVCTDPGRPERVIIGCDVGLFISDDEGVAWANYGQNLPNCPVYDLQFHTGTKLLRAATFGRGVWERPTEPLLLSHASADNVDLYLRDNPLDGGRRMPSPEGPGPLSDEPVSWTGGADIKIDTETWFSKYQKLASTIEYTDEGNADFIAFAALEDEKIHHNYVSRIYAQVHNRGPAVAANVKLRSWFAKKENGGYPNLPADIWTVFPDNDSADVSKWTPLHATTIPEIRPGEPAVVKFEYTFPDLDQIGIVVAVTSTQDPIGTPDVVVQNAVKQNKRVVLKEVEIGLTTGEIVFVTLLVVGVVAGAVVGGVLIANALSD
jgi:photosystem II stability/assembly factor-like uncharacterized protein